MHAAIQASCAGSERNQRREEDDEGFFEDADDDKHHARTTPHADVATTWRDDMRIPP
jgi:hypothetical protein